MGMNLTYSDTMWVLIYTHTLKSDLTMWKGLWCPRRSYSKVQPLNPVDQGISLPENVSETETSVIVLSESSS